MAVEGMFSRTRRGEEMIGARDPRLWCAAAIVIYLFVVSGGLFTLLRGVPFSWDGRYVVRESGWQFGAEVAMVACLYGVASIGMAVIALWEWIPHERVTMMASESDRRMVSMGVLVATFVSMVCVSMLHSWKTGY